MNRDTSVLRETDVKTGFWEAGNGRGLHLALKSRRVGSLWELNGRKCLTIHALRVH